MTFLGALPARFRRERVLIIGCGDVGQRAARELGGGRRVRLLDNRGKSTDSGEKSLVKKNGFYKWNIRGRRRAGVPAFRWSECGGNTPKRTLRRGR